MQTFLSKVSQGYKFIRRLADKAIVGIVDEDNQTHYFGSLSQAQIDNANIKGVAGAGNGKIYDENAQEIPLNTKKEWRGINQAMSPSIQGYDSNAGGISRTIRSRHYFNAKHRLIRPVFIPYAPIIVSGSITDTIHPHGINFQCGYEANYSNSLSGIQPRTLFTFNGSEIARYVLIYGATINQNSNSISCSNILGQLAVGDPVFYNTTLVGRVQSISGTTGIVLERNYTGGNLTAVNMFSHNGDSVALSPDLPIEVPAGCIVGDIFDRGSDYIPGTLDSPNYFGLHTTAECTSQVVFFGGSITSGTKNFTCTSISGRVDIGTPIFNNTTLVGVVDAIVSAGTAYTLKNNASVTVSNQTCYGQGLPFQATCSNYFPKFLGQVAITTQATTTSATASNSNTVTLAGTSSNWAPGQLFVAAGVPDGVYVNNLGTSTGGNGTIILTQPVTLAGVPARGVTSNIQNDTARSASSYSAITSLQGGTSSYFTLAGILVYTGDQVQFISNDGDSINYGSNEGLNGAGTFGDGSGSPLGNRGFFERGVYEFLGGNAWQAARGSDADRAKATNPLAWQYRKQFLALGNSTHHVSACIHNDIAGLYNTAPNGWVGNTDYAKWSVVASGGNAYVCIKAGKSGLVGSSGPSGLTGATTYGARIIDGTCQWAYFGPNNSTANTRGAVQCLANKGSAIEQLKAVISAGTQITAMPPTPDVGTTDQFTTIANQTLTANGWGPTNDSSTRMNAYRLLQIPEIRKILGIDNLMDPNQYWEYLGSGQSGLLNVTGDPYAIYADTTHPSSQGAHIGRVSVNADVFPLQA